MSEPWMSSACDAAQAIAGGEISAVELAEACLARAEAAQERINCFIHLEKEQALDMARAADAARARGEPLGPLHGVPMAHKDCFYRAGRLSTSGSGLRRDFRPDHTATVLQRLDAAGAIDLGGLNMSEWAFGPTGHNVHFGACRNPWSTEHIAGGSSSGSGAALAARVAFGALGTDTGGSVRLPAAMCGVIGLKGTLTRTSRHGLLPQSHSMELPGPLARTARDCARMMSVIAGHDPSDAKTSHRRVPDYESTLERPVRGMRIGVPRAELRAATSTEVDALLDASLAVYGELGAEIVEVELAGLDAMVNRWKVIMAVESAAVHGNSIRAHPQAYAEQVRQRIETGFHVPGSRYVEALHCRGHDLARVMHEVFSRVDVLHAPVLARAVPTLEETDVKGDASMPEVITSIIRTTVPVSYLGLPSISVPAGFTGNGLPAAFQLIGRPFAEARLLCLAHAYQGATDWHLRAPALAHEL